MITLNPWKLGGFVNLVTKIGIDITNQFLINIPFAPVGGRKVYAF